MSATIEELLKEQAQILIFIRKCQKRLKQLNIEIEQRIEEEANK